MLICTEWYLIIAHIWYHQAVDADEDKVMIMSDVTEHQRSILTTSTFQNVFHSTLVENDTHSERL